MDERGRVERIPYELCVLIALRDALRRREIYVQSGTAGITRTANPVHGLCSSIDGPPGWWWDHSALISRNA